MIKVLNRAAFTGDFGLNGDIGGIPRKTYYTPDGRVIATIPSIREFVRKDATGKIIEQGTRDANLDRGWLTTKPETLKLYCKGCDRWHDTKAQVTACVNSQKRFIQESTLRAKKEEVAKNKSLEDKVAELEAKITKLMEAKIGVIL